MCTPSRSSAPVGCRYRILGSSGVTMRPVRIVTLGIACVVSAAACASAGRSPSPVRCVPSELDQAWLAGGAVFRACEVDRPARFLNPAVNIDFQPPLPPLVQSCFAALINVVVDTDGTPEAATARIARTNAPVFARAVLASVPDWRFQPALKNGVAVRQVVSVNRAVSVSVVITGHPGAVPMPPPHSTTCSP